MIRYGAFISQAHAKSPSLFLFHTAYADSLPSLLPTTSLPPFRRRRALPLRAGPPDEAAPPAHDPPADSRIWPLQTDGNICTCAPTCGLWTAHAKRLNHLFLRACIQKPKLASASQMAAFHSDDYIQFLRTIRPENMKVRIYSRSRERTSLKIT
jgi:hypothetical protein